MDVQSVAGKLINALGKNPELVNQLAKHPYSTTAKVTGTNENISQKDMSRVLTAVAAQASGQQLGTTDTKSLASALMGQSGGSVHSLASTLFGGGAQAAASSTGSSGFDVGGLLGSLTGSSNTSGAPSMAEIAAKSIAGAVAARGMAALITGAMNNASKK